MLAFIQLLVSLVLMLHAAALPKRAAGQPDRQHGSVSALPSSPPRANQGHLPPPPPTQSPQADSAERWSDGQVNSTPHVNHDRWYGQDGAGDRRYRLRKVSHINFFAPVGANVRYPIVRVDRNLHRFWIPAGSHFDVAAWNWPLFADWCLDCGKDFVIYRESSHPGWYLLYNLHTGIYVHILYGGQ